METTTNSNGTQDLAHTKWWLQSKTVWGALISALATFVPVLGALLGIDLSGDVVRQAGEQAMGALQAITALVGTLLTIYGRFKADGPLSRKFLSLKF